MQVKSESRMSPRWAVVRGIWCVCVCVCTEAPCPKIKPVFLCSPLHNNIIFPSEFCNFAMFSIFTADSIFHLVLKSISSGRERERERRWSCDSSSINLSVRVGSGSRSRVLFISSRRAEGGRLVLKRSSAGWIHCWNISVNYSSAFKARDL